MLKSPWGRNSVVIVSACMVISCAQPSDKPQSQVKVPATSNEQASNVPTVSLPETLAQSRARLSSFRDVDLDYQRYDATAPVLPEDYPAKHYDASKLLQRFVAIANSPRLSREDVEREFGIRFVQMSNGQAPAYRGVARGRYPLGNSLSHYRADPEGGAWRSFGLSLVGYNADTWDRQGEDERSIKVCVLVGDLYKALGQSGWQRAEPNKGTHYALRIFYRRTVEGRTRRVEPDPASRNGDACIRSFHVGDGTDPGPSSASK